MRNEHTDGASGRFPRRFVTVGALLAGLGGFRFFTGLVLGTLDPIAVTFWTVLVASGIGVLMRRYWARILALALSPLLVLVPILTFAGVGGFPFEALHWIEKLHAVGQVLLGAASVLVLTLRNAQAEFVGNRKAARWVVGTVVAIVLALILFAFLAVEDEGPPDVRTGAGTSTTGRPAHDARMEADAATPSEGEGRETE